MVNLGICRRCEKHEDFSPALVDEDGAVAVSSCVECSLAPVGTTLHWGSELPEGCLYLLEQTMTDKEALGVLVDEKE